MLSRIKLELDTMVFLDQNNIEKGWGGGLFVPFCLKGIVVMHKCLETGGIVSTCSLVRGCSSHERPSMLGRSWISSSDKSFSESWEVQLTGILDVVSNNEPTIMHVSATITGYRPRGHKRAWSGIC